MRSASLAIVLSAFLMPFVVGAGAAAAGQPAASASGEAAARHAKRIACRSAAREKKLFGASRKAYIEHCIANP